MLVPKELIEHARRVLIDLLNVLDDILIQHGVLQCRTVPDKETRRRMRELLNK